MGIVLLGGDVEVTLQSPGVNIDVEIAIDTGREGTNSSMIVSDVAYDIGVSTDAITSDPRTLETNADVKDVGYRRDTISAVSFLMHKDFADFECRYASFTNELAEKFYGRLNRSMQSIANKDGAYCNNTNAANTPHCLTATAPDGRVVIIEPFNSDVRVLDPYGETLINKMLPAGAFEDLIGLAADDEFIWTLHWVSTCYRGANKYVIRARYWDDVSLVEYELYDTGVLTYPDIAIDNIITINADIKDAWYFMNTEAIISEDRFLTIDMVVAVDGIIPIAANINTIYAIATQVNIVDETENPAVSTNVIFMEDSWFIPIDVFVVVGVTVGVNTDTVFADDILLNIGGITQTDYAVEIGAEIEPTIWLVKVDATIMGPEFAVQYPKVDQPFIRDLMDRDPVEYFGPEPITFFEEVNQRYGSFNTENDAWYYMSKGDLSYDEYMEAQSITPLPTHPLTKAYIRPGEMATGWEYDILPAGEDKFSMYVAQDREPGYVNYTGKRPYWTLQDLSLGIYPYSSYWTADQNYYAYLFDPRRNPAQKNNCRYVSNPKIVASETKLFFVMSIRRGHWPWSCAALDDDHIQRRSSYTLVYQVNKESRFVGNPKGMPMSGAMDIQARDDIGLVMMDSFSPANLTDDDTALPGYHSTPVDVRKVHIIAYDLTTLVRTNQRLDFSPWDDRSYSFPYDDKFRFHDLDGDILDTIEVMAKYHNYETDYSYGCQLRLTNNFVATVFALGGPDNYGRLDQDYKYDHGGLIYLLQPDLSDNAILLAPRLPHLLNVLSNEFPIGVKTLMVIHPHDTAYHVKVDGEIWNQGVSPVIIDAIITIDTVLKVNAVVDDSRGLKVDANIRDIGYWDDYKIITNNCPIDMPDPGGVDIEWDYDVNTAGTYLYSTFVWYPGYGEDAEGNVVTSWRFNYKDPTKPIPSFPQPIQYVVDDNTGEQFGLFRLFEMADGLGDYEFIDPVSEEAFILGTNHISDFNAMNYPIGGVLHKYEDVLKEPLKSIAMPGYFNTTATGEFDPFVQYRHVGISTTHKRLYVIRAMGRRDYWHYNHTLRYREYPGGLIANPMPKPMVSRFTSPYIGSNEIDLRSPILSEGLWSTQRRVTTVTGGYAANPYSCDNGVYEGVGLNYTPVIGATYTLVDKHYSTDDVNDIYSEDYHSTLPYRTIDTDKLVYHDQYENDYTKRDILVYDYDFNYITRIKNISGLAEDDVIMHVREKDGTYYILTQAKSNPYNWGQFAQDRSLMKMAGGSINDDKYGWFYKETRLYAIKDVITNKAELVYTLPYGTHASNDVIIQAITEDNVWLNWDAVRKIRAGKILGMAIKRDGTGHTSIPGMVAIIPNKHIEGEYSVLCYKNPAYGGRRFESSKFTRWGREGSNELAVYREKTLTKYTKDFVFAPPEDAPVRGNSLAVLDHVSGMQPGYSQVVYHRHYPWIKVDAVIRDTSEATKPRTWIRITTGGPQVIE